MIELLLPSMGTGCRAFPLLEPTLSAISITRDASTQLAGLDLRKALPSNFDELFNRAILFLLWHQFYSFATRAIEEPYVPVARFTTTGLSTIEEKGSKKTRLIWADESLREHMRRGELVVNNVRSRLGIETQSVLFFLTAEQQPRALQIRPKTILQVSSEFFPFPVNTPRRVMRSLLAPHLSGARLSAFLGHWRERREPWGKYSSFSYPGYLQQVQTIVPDVLRGLGFLVPPRCKKYDHNH